MQRAPGSDAARLGLPLGISPEGRRHPSFTQNGGQEGMSEEPCRTGNPKRSFAVIKVIRHRDCIYAVACKLIPYEAEVGSPRNALQSISSLSIKGVLDSPWRANRRKCYKAGRSKPRLFVTGLFNSSLAQTQNPIGGSLSLADDSSVELLGVLVSCRLVHVRVS